MHKAVILDLGKTLIHFDFASGYQALAAACPYAAAEIPRRIAPTGLPERLETGLIGAREFHREFCRALGLRLDYRSFVRIWNGIFDDVLIPESMLEGLAARYRLLLLSNTNPIHFEGIRERYPVLRHFHDTILSYQVHAMKPRPEIYLAAIERAGCLPGECFYTDDIPAYVEGARSLGMDAVPFENAAQLARDLKTRGIVWE